MFFLDGRRKDQLSLLVCLRHARVTTGLPQRYMIPPVRPQAFSVLDDRSSFSKYHVFIRQTKPSSRKAFGHEFRVYRVDESIRGVSVHLIGPRRFGALGPVHPLDYVTLKFRHELRRYYIDDKKTIPADILTSIDAAYTYGDQPAADAHWVVPPLFSHPSNPWELCRFPYLCDGNGLPYGLDSAHTSMFLEQELRPLLLVLMSTSLTRVVMTETFESRSRRHKALEKVVSAFYHKSRCSLPLAVDALKREFRRPQRRGDEDDDDEIDPEELSNWLVEISEQHIQVSGAHIPERSTCLYHTDGHLFFRYTLEQPWLHYDFGAEREFSRYESLEDIQNLVGPDGKVFWSSSGATGDFDSKSEGETQRISHIQVFLGPFSDTNISALQMVAFSIGLR